MTKTYIDELAEEIAKLREQNDKLNEMCNYWSIEETERTMECYKLKQLLKECREWIEFMEEKSRADENYKGTMYFKNLLTKIDEALK